MKEERTRLLDKQSLCQRIFNIAFETPLKEQEARLDEIIRLNFSAVYTSSAMVFRYNGQIYRHSSTYRMKRFAIPRIVPKLHPPLEPWMLEYLDRQKDLDSSYSKVHSYLFPLLASMGSPRDYLAVLPETYHKAVFDTFSKADQDIPGRLSIS